MGVSPARQVAFEILRRVETDAAYSSELLHAAPTEDRKQGSLDQLGEKDRALATEIVLGCLRWQGELDHLITHSARRPAEQLDTEVRIALRLGSYQLRHLERIPERAAVWESVELVKRAGKRSAAGLVNAVLRRLPPRPPEAQSHELAHPQWLVERWRRNFGPRLTASLLEANLRRPATYLRLNAQYPPDETSLKLAAEGVETAPAESPLASRVVRGRPTETECYRQGRIRIQDLSSQMVVPLLELDSRRSFLDVCAAPGGKTYQAVELRGSAQDVVAGDRHLHRLKTMRRLATSEVDLVVLDAETSLPFRKQFDRILVDVPCSGTGTLARNPEIKWRLRPADLEVLQRKQHRILSSALRALPPGGILVYATCSLEPEENQQVVESTLRERTEFRADAYQQWVPGRDPGDGFFACSIRRR